MSFTITGGEYNTGGTSQFPTITGYDGVIYITSGSSGNIQLNGITIKYIFLVGGGGSGVGGNPGQGGSYYINSNLTLNGPTYSFSVGQGGEPNLSGSSTTFNNYTAAGGYYGTSATMYEGYLFTNNLYYGGSGGDRAKNAPKGGGGGGGGDGAGTSTSILGGTGGGISTSILGGTGGAGGSASSKTGNPGVNSIYGGGGGGGGYYSTGGNGGGNGGNGINNEGTGGGSTGGAGTTSGSGAGGGGGGNGGKNTGGGGGGGGIRNGSSSGGGGGNGGLGGSGIIILLYNFIPIDPTGYKVDNDNYTASTDLKDIFKRGNSGITTNYKLTNGKDLGEVFAAYTSGTKALSVSYSAKINNVTKDLSEIFSPIS